MNEQKKATNGEIYTLLLAGQYCESQCLIPREIIDYIVLSGFHRDCYHSAGYLQFTETILDYIIENLTQNVSRSIIIATLRTCLLYSGKSLCDIVNNQKHTTLHRLFYIKPKIELSIPIEIICDVAGNAAWELITCGDENDSTALHWAMNYSVVANNRLLMDTLLQYAPNIEALCTAVVKKNKFGMDSWQGCSNATLKKLRRHAKETKKDPDECS